MDGQRPVRLYLLQALRVSVMSSFVDEFTPIQKRALDVGAATALLFVDVLLRIGKIVVLTHCVPYLTMTNWYFITHHNARNFNGNVVVND